MRLMTACRRHYVGRSLARGTGTESVDPELVPFGCANRSSRCLAAGTARLLAIGRFDAPDVRLGSRSSCPTKKDGAALDGPGALWGSIGESPIERCAE
jgi:hypothetical protein